MLGAHRVYICVCVCAAIRVSYICAVASRCGNMKLVRDSDSLLYSLVDWQFCFLFYLLFVLANSYIAQKNVCCVCNL